MDGKETATVSRPKPRAQSGYRGVYKVKNSKLKKERWYASFKGVYLGSSDNPVDAAKMYNKVVIAAGYRALANPIPGEPDPVPSEINVDKILNRE